jgi:carboxylesterase type B
VVLVSFNYRVGVIGFLSLDDRSLNVPGNAGLKDQTFALKWIKRNISAFGGDPNDITIFGTSAGGASVHYHLISDQSKDLFNRAIPMSGTAFNTSWALHPRRNYQERIAKNLGYDGEINEKDILKFLEEVDAAKLVEAAMKALKPEVSELFV